MQQPPGSRADAVAELLRRLASFVTEHRDLVDAVLAREPGPVTPATDPSPPPAAIGGPAGGSEATTAPSEADSAPLPGTIVEPREAVVALPIGDSGPPAQHEAPSPPMPVMPVADAIGMLTIGTGVVGRRTAAAAPSEVQPSANPLLDGFMVLRKLARSHERGTRALRRLMRDSGNEQAWNSLEERISEIHAVRSHSWLADPTVRMLVPVESVRALQVRYDALGDALGWLCDFLRKHPDTGRHGRRWKHRDELQMRIQAVATAQCGLRCEIDALAINIPAIAPCDLQDRVFQELRPLIKEDALAMHLSHMARIDVVTIQESKALRAAIERTRAEEDRVDLDRAQAEAIEVDGDDDDAFAPAQEYDSVADAYRAAVARFGGPGSPLVFTRRAEESAERSAFLRPDDVHRALAALHAVTREWHDSLNGAMGASFRDRMRELGFDEKDCTDGTMRHWSNDYYVRYEGRQVPIGQHVTLGSRNANTCLSIHWWRDESRRMTIVAHCGRHLPNTLS